MEEAFGYVLFGVVLVATVIAIVSLFFREAAYRDIGRGGLSLDEPPSGGGGGGFVRAEQEAEIRQMLEARNARRAARGQDPVDVEEELRRLTAPVVDAELLEEVRALVAVRNERRRRRGQPPLDVEEEVRRQLRDLGA